MPATTLLFKEGRYNIEQEFSGPENCSRFHAFDTANETAVTVVEVPLRLPKVATATQREALSAALEQEAEVLKSFAHNTLLPVHDHFSEAGRHYLVTDIVDGIDLNSILVDQKRPFSFEEAAHWADDLLDALHSMHISRPPYFFKAMRPENIILNAEKCVKIVTYAAATSVDPDSVQASDNTVAYLPLEQLWSGLDAASQKVIIGKYDDSSERILKQDFDARSDIYSVGATLYHLVTAHRPVDALERSIEMIEGNADPLKSPNKIDPLIPFEISDVIMKAMEIKREYRFDSAAIMRQVLKTALVRVREREEEGARENHEAANDLKQAAMGTSSENGSGRDPEPVQKIREAEEIKVEAKRQPTEADKKLPETEATLAKTTTESFNLAELDDDLLGLLSPLTHASEPPQTLPEKALDVSVPQKIADQQPALPATEPVKTAVAVETMPTDAKPEVQVEPVEEIAVEEKAEVPVSSLVPETPAVAVELNRAESVEIAPAPENVVNPAPEITSSNHFPEQKQALPIALPALAAAAVVLLAVLVGGWFLLGSASEPTPATPAAQTQTADPPADQPSQDPVKTAYQPETQNQPEPVTGSETEQPQIVTEDDQSQPQKVAVAATAQPKTKKPAPAPTKVPTQKKAVTVDDLINDN